MTRLILTRVPELEAEEPLNKPEEEEEEEEEEGEMMIPDPRPTCYAEEAEEKNKEEEEEEEGEESETSVTMTATITIMAPTCSTLNACAMPWPCRPRSTYLISHLGHHTSCCALTPTHSRGRVDKCSCPSTASDGGGRSKRGGGWSDGCGRGRSNAPASG